MMLGEWHLTCSRPENSRAMTSISPAELLHIHTAIRNMSHDQPYQVHLPSGKALLHGAILSGSEWRRKLSAGTLLPSPKNPTPPTP